MSPTGDPSVSVFRPPPVTEPADRDRTVVRVSGDQDIANVSALSDALASATRADGATVVVDLSGVTFMDASTLGAIVRARLVLESASRSLIVRSPSPCARRLLDLCGFHDLTEPEDVPSPPRTRVTVSRGTVRTCRPAMR